MIWLRTGKALEFSQRERCRAGDHAIDGQPPVRKPSFLQALEGFAQGSDFVRERRFRNLAASELARQGVARQQSLRRIGQSFARTVDAAGIGRNESITARQVRGHGEAGGARGCTPGR